MKLEAKTKDRAQAKNKDREIESHLEPLF